MDPVKAQFAEVPENPLANPGMETSCISSRALTLARV